MASTINTTNIDTTYPIAGQDNDSQGFRDNFTNINTNFESTKSEIEDLQNNVILKAPLTGGSVDNDFGGELLHNAVIENFRGTVVNTGNVGATVQINVAEGPYHKIITQELISSMTFVGWPPSGEHGVVQVEIFVNDHINHLVTLDSAVSVGLASLQTASGQTITFLATGKHILEFASTDNGATVSVNQLTTDLSAVSTGLDNVVDDTTPQLGGPLDVNGQTITSTAAGDIVILPDTTGDIILDGQIWPQAIGTLGYVLKAGAAGQLEWAEAAATTAGYNGWAQAGNYLSLTPTFDHPAVAALDGTTIAYADDGSAGTLRTYSFDGTDWVLVGTPLAIGTVSLSNPAIAAFTSTDVVILDASADNIQAYRWNGVIWATLGNPLAIASAQTGAVAALNSTDIALWEGNSDNIQTYRFDGTNWATVGNPLSIPGFRPGMAALNGTDVAFIESSNHVIQTYRFDGTNWATVGNPVSIGTFGTDYPRLTGLTATDICYSGTVGGSTGYLIRYTFDGTDWTKVSGGQTDVDSADSQTAVTALNENDVALVATLGTGSDRLVTWQLETIIGDVELTAALDDRYVNVAGDTMTGDLTVTGKVTSVEPATQYTTGAAVTLDTTAGTYFYPSGSGTAITFTFDNPAASGNITAFTMELVNGGTDAPTWPASVDWPAATEPTWTATGTDVVSFITRDGGTTWLGMLGGLDFS